jgi:ABC-2 type transport system ATP-binding protein
MDLLRTDGWERFINNTISIGMAAYMNNEKSAISIRSLTKNYGKLRAVDSIDLEINEGEVFALLGPNGAGKTTTISMLTGLVEPTSGSASVSGFDVKRDPLKVRQSIGVVFQQPSVDDLLTGKENLEMHALLYNMPKEGRKERIDSLLALVGLTNRQNSMIREYSGGMRKRLELARGILHHPAVLFLDEPTVGLDPQTREHIWQYISKMAKKEGTTIVFTTHYLEEAEKFAERVAIIDAGKIITVGKPHELVDSLGGDIVNLKVKNPKAAAAKIRRMAFAKNVKANTTHVSASISEPHTNLPKLLRAIGDVESMEIHPSTLNDVFIKFTGKGIREDAAEGGFWERSMNPNNR